MGENILFVSRWRSRWNRPTAYHVTELGGVLDAKFIEWNELNNLTADEWEAIDVVIFCTEIVTAPVTIKLLKQFCEIMSRFDKSPKVIMLDIEGITYHELSFFGRGGAGNSVDIVTFIELLKSVDLTLAMSYSSKSLFQSFVPTANIEVVGFIPVEDEIYLNAIEKSDRKMEEPWLIGMGSKGGAARRGALDVAAIAEFSRQVGSEAIVVPLVGSNNDAYGYIVSISKKLSLFVDTHGMLEYPNYLTKLANLHGVFNFDPLDGASRLAYECARVGTPHIGMKHSLHQYKYWEELGLCRPDPKIAASMLVSVIKDMKVDTPWLVEKAVKGALGDNREAVVNRWKGIVAKLIQGGYDNE